jgi:hypothetical protein
MSSSDKNQPLRSYCWDGAESQWPPSHTHVWIFKKYVLLMLLQHGVNGTACLPNVDFAALTGESLYTQCL